ncbi:MAG TPA: DUF1405 domain-containing protein [Bacillaceae bacterium]
MKDLYPLLVNKSMLVLLLLINIGGTIYGYIWYGGQLAVTPYHFIPFVPDSPTASLFFVFVLLAFVMGKNAPIFEALALITLLKYGIWAVVMNLLTLGVMGYLPWQGYMLIASHAAMAVQGVLYSSFYRMKTWHVMAAAVWTLHNDVIDYVFMQYPKYPGLELYVKEIAYFTFWLSIASILIALYVQQKKQVHQFPAST